jgi:hypothetical protein
MERGAVTGVVIAAAVGIAAAGCGQRGEGTVLLRPVCALDATLEPPVPPQHRQKIEVM